jgi:HEAT repeat protein
MRRVAFLVVLLVGAITTAQPLSAQATKEKEAEKTPPAELGGKKLEQWIAEIADRDPGVRQAAIRTVVQFGPLAKKAVPALLVALHDTDVIIRADAAAAIGLIPLDKATLAKADIDALKGLLEDPQRNVRLQAAITLSRAGPDAKVAIPGLSAGAADSTSWDVRKACCYCLGQVAVDKTNGPDSKAITALTRALGDSCAQVRLEAIMALSNLGMPKQPAELDAEKAALQGRLERDHDKVVILWSRVLLMFLDKNLVTDRGLTTLAKYLEDNDPHVRAQTARAIGTLGVRAKAKMPDLIKALQDREPEVIVNAIQAIGMFGDNAGAAATQAVADMIKEADSRIRASALRTLGAMRAKAYLADITGELKSKDPEVVAAAIDALFLMGELAQPSFPQLEEVAKGENEILKAAAITTIDHIKEILRKK